MNPDSIKKILLGIGMLILQVVFLRHLKIFGMQPDLILIFLLWIMTEETRTFAILMAALLGFGQDALLDLWGLNMFAKILFIFAGYGWISAHLDLRLQLSRTLSVVMIAALAHNLIFILLSLFVHHFASELLFWRHWLGNAVYTTLLACIIQLFRTS